ncbi:hypothetical protein SERLA73DRAFT_44436 [Serpula lacrymans var. lacrymans S7.3]|uniref:CxC1-like cysteine cluster associated with KDZ transposases domain-containing protein n=1 Tax=Serpula lacrymans var. lacrymans (strain S7.3) TaxID=936435 RepID=F8PFU2_SERL3|nr:hypothetical protein SERLA73DRAFT_44436 [Serpula lacrymans var. lacrymans S7.3]
MVAMRKYQRALDHLEGLIVARIFELSKMNHSQTGEQLAQFVAISTALNCYNTAARALTPPHHLLKWKEVIKYTFLSDFDLLRDTCQDMSHRPWAMPAGRLAMDFYFKACRACEEIKWLNVEICRVATYLRDEDKYLQICEEQICPASPALAYQIHIHCIKRGRLNAHHVLRLLDIVKLPGFSGMQCVASGNANYYSMWHCAWCKGEFF